MNTLLFLLGLSCGVIGISIGTVTLVLGQVNVTELDTLDRMRYTAIQMTILSLEAQQPTNMSNDQIAEKIYEFQQNNETDRLTTSQIESLYRNITNGSQVEASSQ